MVILDEFIKGLKYQDRIWQFSEIESISYPKNGNKLYNEIEDQSFWFKYRNNVIYQIIKSYSINGPLFDVGGGNGFVSQYLSEKGIDTVLVEPGIDGCMNGRGRGLKYIINSNFNSNYFFPNRVPNIGLFDVLEHIEDQDKFLKLLHTNLKQGGKLFITVPAFKSLWSEEDNQAGHFRRYRIKELRKLIGNYGFDILFTSYFFSFLVLPIFLFRAIPSKLGFYKISTKKIKNQHLSNSKPNNLLDLLMKLEVNIVRRGKSILFGSSIILVAEKR
jgi:SAM-dependent methyltransferase